MSEAQKTIYLAVWDHKHGQDVSAHTTEIGATKQCALWARETLEDWLIYEEVDYHENLSDDDLLRYWPEISEDTEFFRVDEVQLHEEENIKKDCPNPGCHCGACEDHK